MLLAGVHGLVQAGAQRGVHTAGEALVGGQRVGMEALLGLVLAALPARLLAGELLGHGRGQLLAEGLELLDQGALLGGAGLTRGLLGGGLELARAGTRR